MENATMHDKKGLLDCLIQLVGCNYLSDMHSDEYIPFVCKAVSQLNEDDYSVREWNDAVYYITKVKREFKDPTDAKAFIEEWSRC